MYLRELEWVRASVTELYEDGLGADYLSLKKLG